MPYLNALASFRDQVRLEAKSSSSSSGAILKECDRLRDEVLPELGVRLEDKEGGEKTVIKLVDPEELARERRLKLEAEERKREEKEKKRREAEERKRAQEAQKRIPPAELFKQGEYEGKYSKFDDKVKEILLFFPRKKGFKNLFSLAFRECRRTTLRERSLPRPS